MDSTATPTPTPFDPAATAANVALSNYYLAIILIVAAIVVIVIALGFAWIYHRKALEVIMSAVSRGAQVGSPADGGATTLGNGPRIVGPSSATPSEEVFFGLADVDASKTVAWTAEGGSPSAGGEHTFTTMFAAEGEYIVEVQIVGEPQPLTRTVTVGTPAGSAPAPIAIPFVLKNWGRLVIVLFGVGVIAALMATAVISAEAGIGILGALLGVGATAAASGGGGGGGGGGGTAGTSPPSAPAPDNGSALDRRAKN
jgi:hypothetical protein